jgi:hypothetical protein
MTRSAYVSVAPATSLRLWAIRIQVKERRSPSKKPEEEFLLRESNNGSANRTGQG